MNHRELYVKQKYEREGWKMVRNGAPDLLAVKLNDVGDITEVKVIEVKSRTDHLSIRQRIWKRVLTHCGIPWITEVVE